MVPLGAREISPWRRWANRPSVDLVNAIAPATPLVVNNRRRVILMPVIQCR
jgi:hypothetical protein